jgi:hypothetical protein
MVAEILLWPGIPEACHIKVFQASWHPSPGLQTSFGVPKLCEQVLASVCRPYLQRYSCQSEDGRQWLMANCGSSAEQNLFLRASVCLWQNKVSSGT